MVSDEGLKRKHGEIEVKDSKKLISAVEEKISEAEEACLPQHCNATDGSLRNGCALWFEVGEDMCSFSINEFYLITDMKCVRFTHLPQVVENRLITRYFLTLRGVSRENLELQISNVNFDNNDDAVKLSLLHMIFCIHLSNANSVRIYPKFFALADNLDDFNDFPWGVLSWEATRAAICNTVEIRMSLKRRPLKKFDKVHYSIAGFSHALLVWAYETLLSIAAKFTTKYDQAIPRMLSWITADNVKFDDVMSAFTAVGENQVDSMNKKLEDLKKGQKNSTKLLRRVLKLLSDNMNEKGQGKAHTAYHVSSRQKINVQTYESDALKTTSNDLGSGSQDDVFVDFDIGAVADMGVQAAMEFLTVDKVIVSHENVEEENNKESMPDPEKEKDDKESIKEQEVIKLEEATNEESIGDVIPKKKRARLSRLGQRRSGPMTEVGSPSHAPSKLIYAFLTGLADEPPKEKLEDKRPPRYNAKYETLDKPHDLGFMAHIDVAFYYLRKKIKQFPKLEQRNVSTVDTFFSAKIILGVCVRSGSSWYEVNTLLIPIHLANLKHWALVKLDLTNWTIEVYDSLQHEGPYNFKVREEVECISKFIPLLADRLNLFEFKPREPPRIYPIPVTIMKDIPQQANEGNCGMFTIKYAECLIEGRDACYWVDPERNPKFFMFHNRDRGHNCYDHWIITGMIVTLKWLIQKGILNSFCFTIGTEVDPE
ncbi:hypothetical protein TIFTF001_008906 [Ficus carica]|uniref:Ubiquitin-like protease family profile domain-containing protein n=1 Tax=Ficus carica TaxID=3494 RepID=A0AA88D0Y4_FICCA|nr:hypothetical protein TIFTF001_008906 [Ficus carica]